MNKDTKSLEYTLIISARDDNLIFSQGPLTNLLPIASSSHVFQRQSTSILKLYAIMPPTATSARQTHSAGQRVQALAYLQAGWQQKDVANAVGLTQPAISRLAAKAKERGWNPDVKPIIELEWVVDKPRSGRPHALSPQKEAQVIETVENGKRDDRDLSAAAIATPLGVSDSTIRRIMTKAGLHPGK